MVKAFLSLTEATEYTEEGHEKGGFFSVLSVCSARDQI
jgi:hypothetical protein